MKEFQGFDTWLRGLDVDWDVKGEANQIPIWLKARDDAAFRWAWNRAARNVTSVEEKTPLDEAKTVWLEHLEITVEMVVECALPRHDEFSSELWACVTCVYADSQLLARATRLQISDLFLDKLRAEYNAGRFPRGTL